MVAYLKTRYLNFTKFSVSALRVGDIDWQLRGRDAGTGAQQQVRVASRRQPTQEAAQHRLVTTEIVTPCTQFLHNDWRIPKFSAVDIKSNAEKALT